MSGLERLFERLATDTKLAEIDLILNPSPITEPLLALPLSRVDTFVLNEGEAARLCGQSPDATESKALLDALRQRFPEATVVLTLGERGSVHADAKGITEVEAVAVRAVDTTGAGDTFTGFFLAERARGSDPRACLALACRAAARCVTRPGAAASIPSLAEL